MRSVDQRDESLIYEALGVACSLTHSTRIGCLVGTVLISMSVELFAMACSKHWGSRPLSLPHPAKSKNSRVEAEICVTRTYLCLIFPPADFLQFESLVRMI